MTQGPPQDTPNVDRALFRALMSSFASGVTIVTACDPEGHPHGMTVSAFASVSLDPPLILVSIDHSASMRDLLLRAPYFVVNVLAAEQDWLSRRFADEAMELRFDGVSWTAGAGGTPRLAAAHATVTCVPHGSHDAGDHVILLGRVVEGFAANDTMPLLYHRAGYRHLMP